MPIKNIALFVAGLGLGSVGTLLAVKNHYKTFYENRCDEDCKAYKEWTKENIMEIAEREFGESAVNPEKEEPVEEKENEPNYQKIINKLNYGDYSQKDDKVVDFHKEDAPAVAENKGPYVIGPDEFANDEQYDKITLTYFSDDGVFMSIEEEVVPEGMQAIGEENLDHIGEIEENVVYVRNEGLNADYEVILEERAYSDSEYVDGNYEDE